MLLPVYLGILHAVEPDHVAAVTGVGLEQGRAGGWRVGLAFGVSHMLAVALLAGLAMLAGQALLGERVFHWLDRAAWGLVILLGFWNLAAAAGWRSTARHAHAHVHGGLRHSHTHDHGPLKSHGFHHAAAWLGAFFGLGGLRSFTSLQRNLEGPETGSFLLALLLFGLGITGTFMLLSLVSGWVSTRVGAASAFRRGLFGVSGLGNLLVGFWLLLRP